MISSFAFCLVLWRCSPFISVAIFPYLHPATFTICLIHPQPSQVIFLETSPLPNALPNQFSVPVDTVIDSTSYRLAKRAIDVLGSGLGMLALSPFYLLLCLVVRLTSPGPVFYPWNVIGLGGRPFRGYKFRTMVQDADVIKQDLLHANEMSGPVFKMKNDPRITPLGRFLRKYSLDELPQLWSVFIGDMSLVGPRPAGPHEWIKYEAWQRRKLSVVPGITCLWQVSGRNEISNFDEWVKLDLEYIDRWSLWLDFQILLRTILVVLKGTGM